MGQPLLDLGDALPLSKSSELVLAPSARRLIELSLPGKELQNGCFCLEFSKDNQLTPQSNVLLLEQGRASLSGSRSSDVRSSFEDNGGINSRSRPQRPSGIGNSEDMDKMLRFVPEFVKQRLLVASNTDMLAEIRQVSILFITGKVSEGCRTFQEDGRTPRDNSQDWVESLRLSLGEAIDLAEGELGAATRQVTMDDKGVAAIFVFGLPGSLRSHHEMTCATAAMRVLEVLQSDTVHFTAGLTTGSAFCGLVGDPARRCEYAVMGDLVNTAARLSGYAAKNGLLAACVQDFKDSLERSNQDCDVKLVLSGTTQLKGKEGELTVYGLQQKAPTDEPSSTGPLTSDSEHRHHGREQEIQLILDFIADHGAVSNPEGAIMVVTGKSRMGKTRLLDTLTTMLTVDGESPNQQLPIPIYISTPSYQTNPFQACHSLLEWVLAEHDEERASKFSKLEGLPMSTFSSKAVPDLIKPHAKEIQSLNNESMDSTVRIRRFLDLYVKILRKALAGRRFVLLLDDIHFMSSLSILFLQQLVRQQPSTKMPKIRRSTIGAHYPLIIVASHISVSKSSASFSEKVGPPSMHLLVDSRVQCIDLPPLDRKAIISILQDDLNCGNVTSELVSLIEEHSGGVPSHVVEVSHWLQDQGHLEVLIHNEGITVGVKSNAVQDGTVGVLPSVRNIVQSQIDQLPAALVLVLRCASIFGVVFSEHMLLLLLGHEVHLSAPSLRQQLKTLRDLQFLSPLSRIGGNRHRRQEWKFQHGLHQQVVYDGMLMKLRRNLHQRMVSILKSELVLLDEYCKHKAQNPDADTTEEEDAEWEWTLRERLISQRMQCMDSAVKGVTVAEFEIVSGELAELKKHMMASGYVEEWVQNQNRRLEAFASSRSSPSISKAPTPLITRPNSDLLPSTS